MKRSRNCLPLATDDIGHFEGRPRHGARTVIEAAALVDAGELQFLDGVGDLLQVLRGQVQIPGGGLQILMPEQKLDGAQVGTGFQQMRGPAVANQVGRNSLADARPLSSFAAATPYDLVRNRLLVIAMQS